MKQYVEQPESKSHTLDSTPRSSRQASISEILQSCKKGAYGMRGDSKIIQKKDCKAKVVWGVTHEVLLDENKSLFGNDSDPFANEGIELNYNDRIVVDDDDIVLSRRGANQEIEERRTTDKAGPLTNKWLRLTSVLGKKDTCKGYVREETIEIEKGFRVPYQIHIDQLVDLEAIGPDQEKKTAEQQAMATVDHIHSKWAELRQKRRMSMGPVSWSDEQGGTDEEMGAWEYWETMREEKGKDTSPSWDQIEEGYDVSKELSTDPKEEGAYEVTEDFSSDQAIFIAKVGEEPIGIIVIENRSGESFPAIHDDDGEGVEKKWYVRWLVGHPTLKGAGVPLLKKALKYVGRKDGTRVWVQSAPSAVGWYARNGFIQLEEEIQQAYDPSYEEGWDSVLMYREIS